jgi:hypothetical protein
MSNEPRLTDGLNAYPRRDQERGQRQSGRSRAGKAVLVAAGPAAGCGLVMTAGVAVLYGFNPMGDEWVCSDGEAPAGAHGNDNACYVLGEELPPRVSWDPFGNRPMPYNCDKDGWVLIERAANRRGGSDDRQDCVREGTVLHARNHRTAPRGATSTEATPRA